MSAFVDPILFAIFALVSIGCAIGMFMTRNIVHEGFLLLGATVGIAGLYLIMGYSFMALVQFLIYSGAVSILLVFSIMITSRSRADVTRPRDFSVMAAGIAVLFFIVIITALLQYDFLPAFMPERFPTMAEIGAMLYAPEGWVFPFEIASLVLLSALLGAVWWSRERDD